MKYALVILIFFAINAFGQTDPVAQAQADCAKNTGKTWSAEVNRCVDSAQAIAIQSESRACETNQDLEARKNCHVQLAAKYTGIDSNNAQDTLGKMSDLQTRSAIINGASTIVAAINFFGSSGKNSKCMCKNVFGVTAVAGLASDVYIKMKTNKAMDELKNKYQIDLKTSSYNAQYKALEYLRD